MWVMKNDKQKLKPTGRVSASGGLDKIEGIFILVHDFMGLSKAFTMTLISLATLSFTTAGMAMP